MKETKISRAELNTTIVTLCSGFMMFGIMAIFLIKDASTMSVEKLVITAAIICSILIPIIGIAWLIPYMIKGFHEPFVPHPESWQ